MENVLFSLTLVYLLQPQRRNQQQKIKQINKQANKGKIFSRIHSEKEETQKREKNQPPPIPEVRRPILKRQGMKELERLFILK